jgi:hypothetical protein
MMPNLAYYYNFKNYNGIITKEITEIEEINKELKLAVISKKTKSEILSSIKGLLRKTINSEVKR